MKGELQMRFLGIADIEEGLGIFAIKEDCFKKKFASKKYFLLFIRMGKDQKINSSQSISLGYIGKNQDSQDRAMTKFQCFYLNIYD